MAQGHVKSELLMFSVHGDATVWAPASIIDPIGNFFPEFPISKIPCPCAQAFFYTLMHQEILILNLPSPASLGNAFYLF